MGIVYNRKTRRQFLVGSGKTLLALPFLPSLFGSDALAQAAFQPSRRLMIMLLGHANPEEFWPRTSFATDSVNGSPYIKDKLLSSLATSTDISPLLGHSVYNQLRQQNQLTIVRGLRAIKGTGHNLGALGGNVETASGAIIQGDNNWPTFDSLIENSPSVYPNTTPSNVTKAIRVNLDQVSSFLQKTGSVAKYNSIYGYDGNKYYSDIKYYTLPVLYADIFKGLTNGTATPIDSTNLVKTNILNRVHQSFSSFKSSRKISGDDLARLDQHLGFISDLQRSLNSLPQSLSCNTPGTPLKSSDAAVYTPLYFELMALAFKCGLTKFGAICPGDGPTPGLTLPQGVELHGALHGGDPKYQSLKGPAYKSTYTYGYDMLASRFLAPLNELEGNTGRSYIDNMATVVLTQMSIESIAGGSGHDSTDCQQMLIGSMGGRMRSGKYLFFPPYVPHYLNGLPHNALTTTLLELMGVPKSEYSLVSSGGKGYGFYDTPRSDNPFISRYYDPITELLV